MKHSPATGASDHLAEMWNLPGGFAGVAFHPPVVPAGAVLDLQQDPKHGGIGLAGELALRRVASGLRIERVESSTLESWRVVMLYRCTGRSTSMTK